MSLRFRFLNYITGGLILDTPAIEATLDMGVNKSAEWSASFPANITAILELRPADQVEIYYNAELLLQGTIEEIKQSYDLTQKIDIKGKDFLDLLFIERADTNLSVQDQSVLLVLDNLLKRAGWKLGDVSTFVPSTLLTTLDLRSEKQLIAQIQAVINSVGKYNYRQGKTVKGVFTLDVGVFGERSNVRFVTPPSGLGQALSSTNLVQSFSAETSNTPLMTLIEPRGGDIQDVDGAKRTLTLRSFVETVPANMARTDFPIIEERFRQRYSVVNAAWGRIGGTVEGHPAQTQNIVWLGSASSSTTLRAVLSTYAYGGKLGYLDFFQSASTGNAGPFTGGIEIIVQEAVADLTAPQTANPNPILFTKFFPLAGLIVNGVANRRVRFDMSDSNLTLEWGKRYSFFMQVLPAPVVINAIVLGFLTGFALAGTTRYSSALAFQGISGVYIANFRLTTFSELNRNARIAKVAETWTQYTPPQKETNSTAAEIFAASTALYNRTVQVLKERQVEPTQYKLSALGSQLAVRLGSLVYINTYSESSRLNESTQTPAVFRNRIEGNFYVLEYSLKFSANNVTADYTLLDEISFRSSGNVVDLYDTAKTPKQPVGEPAGDLGTLAVTEYTLNLANTNANATLNGAPALLVEVTGLGASAAHTTFQVLGKPVVSAANAVYREIEMVNYEEGDIGTAFRFLISLNRSWDASNTATVKYTLAAR